MIGVFLSLDLFLFYVFWDAMLIPMYFLIGIWGYDRRIYAAVKFILYTMAGSVLMLVAILGLAWLHQQATGQYSFDLLKLYTLQIPPSTQYWFFLAFALAFAIKVPLFPFHTWLPDAHVEAPTAGLDHPGRRAAEDGHVRPGPLRVPAVPGGRGLLCAVDRRARGHRHRLRRARGDGPAGHEEAGGLLVGEPPGLRRARHLRDEHAGLQGAVYQMLAHGVSTGGLFLIVGMLSDRRHTRLIAEFGGLKHVMPRLTAVFLLITLASIGLPTLERLHRRVPDHRSAASRGSGRTPRSRRRGVILSAVYMLWMVQRVYYGPVTNQKNQSTAGSRAA